MTLRYSRCGRAPANTRLFAVRSPRNVSSYKTFC